MPCPEGKPYSPYPESAKELIRQKCKLYWDSPDGLSQRELQHNKMLGENNPNYGKIYTDEERDSISIRLAGLKRTEEQRKHYSDSKKGKKNPNFGKSEFPGLLAMQEANKENPPMLGKSHTEETKQKIRLASIGRTFSHTEIAKQKISIGNKGKREGIEPWNKGLTSRQDSRIISGKDSYFSKVRFYGEQNGFFGKHHTQESIERMLEARTYAGPKCPNNPEKKLLKLLVRLYPRRYHYTGNKSLVEDHRLRPDISSKNGEREIIELFGDYWHSEEITGRRREDEEEYRVKRFSEFGYRTLIIWEEELANEASLVIKIKNFVEVGNG